MSVCYNVRTYEVRAMLGKTLLVAYLVHTVFQLAQ